MIADIAEQANVPRKFLEQILLELKKRGIVHSQRGKFGGYALAREPDDISFAELIRIIDGPLALSPCVSRTAYRKCDDCEDEVTCAIRKVLLDVRDSTAAILENWSLAQALAGEKAAKKLRRRRRAYSFSRRCASRANPAAAIISIDSIEFMEILEKQAMGTAVLSAGAGLSPGSAPVGERTREGLAMRFAGLLAASLLSGISAIAPASAASSDFDLKIDALREQIDALNAQVADLERSASSEYADVQAQRAKQPIVKIDNGRFSVSSADGRFTAAVRALFQHDWADYSQSASASALPGAYGPELSSGANFRRVYLGLQGKVFGDWSYNFNYDFGGSAGTETPGHIQSVYLQFDGFAPFALRIGAYPPPVNIEDGTSSGDTIFLERNAPSDLQRNIAGGDGRDAVTLLYTGERIFGAFSYSGDKVQDGSKALAPAGATAAPIYNEQQGLVGRLAYLPVSQTGAHWLVGVNGTYVIKPADSVPNGSPFLATMPGTTAKNGISLSAPPELTVDSNGVALASTGLLPANHLVQWGLETAGNWRNFYGQAGYYDFNVDRARIAFNQFTAPGTSHVAVFQPSSNNFGGLYLQGTWTLTGESRDYNPSTGAFTPPKPAHPFALDGSGWGAFELGARFSDLNLNDRVSDPANVVTAWTDANKTYDYFNTVRGGDQRIWTGVFNWYPNSVVRFALQYQWIDIGKLQSGSSPNPVGGLTVTTSGTPAIPAVSASQHIRTIAVRTQISF